MYVPLLSKYNLAVTWSCNTGLSQGCNTGQFLASNFCCDETEPRKLHTLLTSTVQFLGFNQAETTCLAPARRKPSIAGAKLGKSSCSGSWTQRKPSIEEVTRSPTCCKWGQWKMNSAESACSSVSDSRRPLIKVGDPHSHGWKDMCLTKSPFLYSLSFLVSSNPWEQGAAVGATEGLWQGLILSVSQGLHRLLGPRSWYPSHGSSSVLNLLCTKGQANENSTSQAFSRFSGRLWRGFLGTFFLLLFPPVLSSSLLGLELGPNPWCLASGPNET